MKLLVAKKDEAGRWQRIAILTARKDGSLSNVPARHRGRLETGLAKEAARHFASEPAAATVHFDACGAQWRVDRFD